MKGMAMIRKNRMDIQSSLFLKQSNLRQSPLPPIIDKEKAAIQLPNRSNSVCFYSAGDIIPGLSNEYTIAVNPDHPEQIAVSANDYSAPGNEPRGYVESSQNAALNFERYKVPANPKTSYPVNGDMILRPKPMGGYYGSEMAFAFSPQDENGVKIFTVNSEGSIDPLSVKWVVRHSGSGSSQPFEDKDNLAVDLDPKSETYGWRVLTNTQFHSDGTSQINLYLIDPQNNTADPINITAQTKQNEVQWSAPAFGKGGAVDVAFRDYNTNWICDSHSSGVKFSTLADSWKGKIRKFITFGKSNVHQTKSLAFEPAKPIAPIVKPVEEYYQKKYGSDFRVLSAPQMVSSPTDGSLYMIYDDAKTGKAQTYLVKGDGKGNWSEPFAGGDPNIDHWMSSAAVDAKTGIIGVTYRALQSDGNTYVREGVLSFDGGKTWTDPINLSYHPSLRMQDGFQGKFDGDYEETGIGTKQDSQGNTILYLYAPHQETPFGKDASVASLRVGTLIADLPAWLLGKAKEGDKAATAALSAIIKVGAKNSDI
jgi:hypothetical protein